MDVMLEYLLSGNTFFTENSVRSTPFHENPSRLREFHGVAIFIHGFRVRIQEWNWNDIWKKIKKYINENK
jgi:hypothetical protein